jgi:hypothetical protein
MREGFGRTTIKKKTRPILETGEMVPAMRHALRGRALTSVEHKAS